LTVTLRFSPRFGSSPVNLALANSKAVTTALAGPSHNSAVIGSTLNKHTSGSLGPPGHHTSSVFRQAAFVFSASQLVSFLIRSEMMGLAAYEIIGNDAEWRVRHDGKPKT
jgi:hypothetical protein